MHTCNYCCTDSWSTKSDVRCIPFLVESMLHVYHIQLLWNQADQSHCSNHHFNHHFKFSLLPLPFILLLLLSSLSHTNWVSAYTYVGDAFHHAFHFQVPQWWFISHLCLPLPLTTQSTPPPPFPNFGQRKERIKVSTLSPPPTKKKKNKKFVHVYALNCSVSA